MSGWTARARRLARALAPRSRRLPAEFHFQRSVGKLDATLARIPLDRRRPGRAIDVGANTGAYTYAFSRAFAFVEAFEPQPWCAAAIADFARADARVRVHRLGASDRAHHATLYVPIVRGRWRSHLATGLASLTANDRLPSRAVPVDLIPLDAFAFDDVACIKIDVEGHEREVLAGARETVARCRPTIIVEIEQRHLPAGVRIEELFTTLTSIGYRGSYLRGGAAEPLERFDVERDQNAHVAAIVRGDVTPGYINNFVFEPAGLAGERRLFQ